MLAAIVLLATLASSDPAAFVRSLYDLTQRGEPDPLFQVKSRAALLRTFEGPIVDLIWRDLVDAQGEVGRIDGHYLYDAQDTEIRNLRIRTLDNADGRARVVATFDFSPTESRTIEFQLRETPEGWRISNIVYPNGNFMDWLKADFPLPKVEDERAEKAVCGMYETYPVNVPEGYDPEYESLELAEYFANGEGGTPDFGAAIHFICRANGLADAETWGMLQHVLHMERGATDEPLDFCGHATSRDGGIICAGRREQKEGAELQARYEAVLEKYGKPVEVLRAAADAFIQADVHWQEETMREGTIYAYIGTHLSLDHERTFVELLETFSEQRADAASAQDFKRADAELNETYRKRVAFITPCDPEFQSCSGPTEQENLRDAQRAWIRYRDAWIAYYQQRWRGAAPRDVLRREIATRITSERTADLTLP